MGTGDMTAQDGGARVRVRLPREFADLLPGYLERREGDSVAISAAMDEGHLDSIGVIGHRMKGTGLAYGLEFVSRAGAAIEEAAARGDRVAVRTWARDLSAFIARIDVVVDPVEAASIGALGEDAP